MSAETKTKTRTGTVKKEEAKTAEPATTITPETTNSRANKKASASGEAVNPDNKDEDKTTDEQTQSPDSPSQEEESNFLSPPCSQISVGGEDDQLRMLDRSGGLIDVIGSQSILSQELMDLNPSQREGLFVVQGGGSDGEASPEATTSTSATTTATTTTTTTKVENSDEKDVDDDSKHDSSSPPPEVEEIPSSQLSVNAFSQLSYLMDAAQAIEDAEDSQKAVADMLEETKNYEATTPDADNNDGGESPCSSPASIQPDKSTSLLTTRVRPKRPPAMTDPETENMKARVDTLIQKALAEKEEEDGEEDGASVGSKGSKRSGDKKESPRKRSKNGAGNAVKTKQSSSRSSSPNGTKDASNGECLTPFQQRKLQKQQDQKQAQELAQQAADLAAQIIAHPHVAKQLLLTMALRRINPRAAPSTWPAKGSVIADGFFWGTYPPLETVLRANMRSYYDLSTKMCQSKDQQSFNNDLTDMIRQEASRYGWQFDPQVFTDKVLRDRIRCFFKTHIQNSKKRLRTLIKNPTKKANAKALVAHLELIQTYSQAEADGDEENFLNGGTSSSSANGKKTTGKTTTNSVDKKAEMARQAAKSYKHLTVEEHALPAPRKNEVKRKQPLVSQPDTASSSSSSTLKQPQQQQQGRTSTTSSIRRRGRPKKRTRAEQEAAESVMALVASAAAASKMTTRSGSSSAPRKQAPSPVANPIGSVEAL